MVCPELLANFVLTSLSVKVEHLQRWSQIFQSEQTKTFHSTLAQIFGTSGIMEHTLDFCLARNQDEKVFQ